MDVEFGSLRQQATELREWLTLCARPAGRGGEHRNRPQIRTRGEGGEAEGGPHGNGQPRYRCGVGSYGGGIESQSGGVESAGVGIESRDGQITPTGREFSICCFRPTYLAA